MSVEVFREQRSRDVGLAAVAVAPFLAVAVALALMATNRDRYNWLIREDGPVEWMTIAIYVVAAAAAAYTTRRLWSAGAGALVPLYALFSLGLLVIAGEEASWGQRQIGFDTPQAVREVNTKGEFNFHNASGFPVHLAFILVSLYGTLGRPLIGPFLARVGPVWRDLLTVPPVLAGYFAIPAALYIYFELGGYLVTPPPGATWYDLLASGFITGKEQEPIELLLACGFLLFAAGGAWLARDLRKRPR